MDEVVSLMPELKKIDTLLTSYQNDTLPRTYNYLLSNYQHYDSIANDSAHQTLVVRQQASRQRTDYLGELQNWQVFSSTADRSKTKCPLQPVYDKVLKAIDEVAKKKDTRYVFNRESLLVGPPADNLLPMVAEKLKVKCTTGYGTQTQKPAPKTGN